MKVWLLPAVAYLLGAIPFGYLIVRVGQGRDIRRMGSGNIGAANVTRQAGLLAGVLVLLLDAGKGYLAVWLAAQWTEQHSGWMAAAALAAVVGHCFPVFLGFRGGRGVATGAGAFLAVSPAATAAALVVFFVVVMFWRYISLGSIVAAGALPVLIYALYAPGHAPPTAISLAATAAAVLIIWQHRPNLRRLAAGTEPKFSLRRRP
ncbi:MAG: glycerol-3-phosphate 1-O-acyltransferase PlsY [Acidobacteriia bacterium]|jgi:glycerol-3-phosphate acyltransferase PlsY|nr:glycerol-3-phosphate 1-O-acyltransferase PlsY [Terriglobia bacterium]